MSQIDREATWLGTIEESGLSLSKSQYPQAVLRLKATQKWVDSPEEMTHFSLEAPGYVPWAEYNEDIVGYFVMFKSATEFSDATKLLNYEQLQLATGWDGTSFDAIADGSFKGKEILFRTKNEEYQNKITLKVAWIDSKDAEAGRSIKNLDANEVKGLSALLKAGGLGGKKTATPAKPSAVGKPVAPAAAKPVAPTATPTPAPTAPSSAPQPSSPPAAPAATPPKKTPKKKETPAPTPPPPAAETSALPKKVSKLDAWNYVCSQKGENEDSVIEVAWMDMCAEVLGDRDEDTATEEDWAKVRDLVLKDIAA